MYLASQLGELERLGNVVPEDGVDCWGEGLSPRPSRGTLGLSFGSKDAR